MSDFLLVHGAAQGARSWSKVWGHMTAPQEHPPPLYRPRQAVRVRAVDLPGHGADQAQDTALVDLSESVGALAHVVQRENFSDYVLVGHELGGTVALHAAASLPTPPRRIVLVSGIVPAANAAPLSCYPIAARLLIRLSAMASGLSGRDIAVPAGALHRYWCRGLDPMQRIETVGHLNPLPIRMLTQKTTLDLDSLPCPITYIVLTGNRLVPPARQRIMAARIPGAAVIELDAGHQAAIQKPRQLAETLLAAA